MRVNGKWQQDRVLTAIVGSYPKPKYVYPGTGRQLIDTIGFGLYEREKKLGKREFKSRLDKAALMAIRDQNKAGIDWGTDGEERRGSYIMDILRGLGGIDFNKLGVKYLRGKKIFPRKVPTITGPIKHNGPIKVAEFLYTKKFAQKMPKIGLPGPTTAMDSVIDEYYGGDLEAAAWAYAKAIRNEVKALIKAGCRVIQFDDPVLLRYPDKAKKWGLKTLQACFEGLENKATYVVHICCGYPNKPLEKKGINYKSDSGYYRDVLKWLSQSTIDVVSIEGAQSKLDLSVLPAIGKKTVMLGVVDVGVNKVESVGSLVKRGKEALEYLPKNQLILAPDCGMLELTRPAALRKLKNMAQAAQILNRES